LLIELGFSVTSKKDSNTSRRFLASLVDESIFLNALVIASYRVTDGWGIVDSDWQASSSYSLLDTCVPMTTIALMQPGARTARSYWRSSALFHLIPKRS
jgi:hypothetical protein